LYLKTPPAGSRRRVLFCSDSQNANFFETDEQRGEVAQPYRHPGGPRWIVEGRREAEVASERKAGAPQ
jgi:hypothetical protein